MKPDQAKDVDGNEGDHIADNLDKKIYNLEMSRF